jgi:multiple sugar transport system permease protein
MTIPRDLDEAAIIDGSGYFRIYWQIILPLSKPAIAAIVIFQFVGTWNDFFGPLVYLNDESKYTLSIGLAAFRGVYATEWALLMAASIVVVMPCLLIYFFAQKYFIQGVVFSGIRG